MPIVIPHLILDLDYLYIGQVSGGAVVGGFGNATFAPLSTSSSSLLE